MAPKLDEMFEMLSAHGLTTSYNNIEPTMVDVIEAMKSLDGKSHSRSCVLRNTEIFNLMGFDDEFVNDLANSCKDTPTPFNCNLMRMAVMNSLHASNDSNQITMVNVKEVCDGHCENGQQTNVKIKKEEQPSKMLNHVKTFFRVLGIKTCAFVDTQSVK